jgi:hypothetical protein
MQKNLSQQNAKESRKGVKGKTKRDPASQRYKPADRGEVGGGKQKRKKGR